MDEKRGYRLIKALERRDLEPLAIILHGKNYLMGMPNMEIIFSSLFLNSCLVRKLTHNHTILYHRRFSKSGLLLIQMLKENEANLSLLTLPGHNIKSLLIL